MSDGIDLGSLFDKINTIAADVQKIRAEASDANASLATKVETIAADVQNVLVQGDAIAKAAGLSDTIDKIVAALEKHLGVAL
jgi:hypothetical protein